MPFAMVMLLVSVELVLPGEAFGAWSESPVPPADINKSLYPCGFEKRTAINLRLLEGVCQRFLRGFHRFLSGFFWI
jgi:hypothetical protein